MSRVRRFDTGTLKTAEKRPNGWLRVEGYSARVGILEYDQPDGTVRRELVLPEELFKPESMASAALVPVTHRHPEALLDDKTARAHQVGAVGESLRADGDFLVAPMMLTDAEAIADVERGNTGLSWGYDCDLLPPRPDLVTKWGPHDSCQANRTYNHLACGVVPRAGAQARIRLDAAGNACDPFATPAPPVVASAQTPAPTSAEKPVMKIKIGKHTLDASDANQSIVQEAIDREIADLTARADAAEKAKATAEQMAIKNATNLDGYKKRVDAFRAKIKAKLDGMKARMMGCDECGGSGKVMDAGGAEAKCDYCDGAGSIRMHEAVKAMAPAGDGPHPDEDMEEMGEELDSGVPERESAAEEKLETIANPEHPKLDAASRKQRQDARRAARATARQRHADSMERRASRRAVERAALLATAGKHLDGDALKALDGKPDLEIKRAVVAKLAPHLDGVEKMDAAQVVIHFNGETKRADAAGTAAPQLSESDRLRAAIAGAGSGGHHAPAARVDAAGIVQSAADAKANAWRRTETR